MKWVDGIAERVNGDGSRSWVIRYRVPLARNSTKTKRVVETLPNCDNRRQAQKVLESRNTDVFRGEWTPKTTKAPETVRSYFETFLNAKRDLATVKKYRSQLNRLLVPFFADTPLDAITPAMCNRYRLERQDAKKAASTIRSELRCLQSLMSEARSDGLCERDPVASVSIKVDNARGRVLSDAELGRLIKEARTFTNFVRPLFFVLYVTGARLSEAMELEWSSVDFENGWIKMRNKGSMRKRAVMNAMLHAELELWHTRTKGKWVFPAAKNKNKHSTIWIVPLHWRKLLVKAEVTNLVRHDMRHNLVTRLIGLGASSKETMQQSGHATLSMLNRYTHPDVAALTERLDRLPGHDPTMIPDDAKSGTNTH